MNILEEAIKEPRVFAVVSVLKETSHVGKLDGQKNVGPSIGYSINILPQLACYADYLHLTLEYLIDKIQVVNDGDYLRR